MNTWINKIADQNNLAAARQQYGIQNVTDDVLQDLSARLREGRHTFGPARRFYRPKADGSRRPLVSLAPSDKIVMRAALTVIQPELNTELSPFCFSRVGSGTRSAVAGLYLDLQEQRPDVVFIGDFTDYYGTIDRDRLQDLFESKFADDGALLDLLLRVLHLDVVDDEGRPAHRDSGIEQGLPLSPLFSNLYLSRVFDSWLDTSDVTGYGRYGDDFYVLPRVGAAEYGAALRHHLTSIGLSLKEEKVAFSTAFSSPRLRALDPGSRDDAGAIEWLKCRFVPHRLPSGSYNVIVDKDGDENDEE